MAVSGELERTYRRSRNRLLAYIRQRVASAEEAEDILQEVFAAALRSYSVTEPIEDLLAWLFQAARNRIVDWYRRKRRRLLPLPGSSDEDDCELEELLASSGPQPHDEAARAALLDELADGIEELPAAQREVIVEQAIEGRTFREIAGRTGVPLGTLLARKQAAIRSLRRRLEGLR